MKNDMVQSKYNDCFRSEHRMNLLFDNGTAKLQKPIENEGFCIGNGEINGRITFAVSIDSTVKGGSMGEAHINEICNLLEEAIDAGNPFIFILESAGARIQEGINSLDGYGRLFNLISSASGKIPLIAVITGTCAGGTAYTAALCDIVIMQRSNGKMFVTGSKVLKKATGEDSTNEELGSADVHTKQSGIAHFCERDDELCVERVKDVLSYLPQNYSESPPHKNNYANPSFDTVLPSNPKRSYDVRLLIQSITDVGSFSEQQPEFASNIVIGLGRIHGKTVGIVANQPNVLCGALDIDASCKAARFINFCDCFNIPLVTIVDTPGFLPGKSQEQSGLLRHGAKLLAAYSSATVPKITLITRKAIGGAYIAMNSNGLGADAVLAFKGAKISVLDGSTENLITGNDVKSASNLDYAFEKGIVSKLIIPSDAREEISAILEKFSDVHPSYRGKKHGNPPQ